MNKIVSLLALLSCSVFAQRYDLSCIKGKHQCSTTPCITIIVNNKTKGKIHVEGQIEAALSAAARTFHDGNFDFMQMFDTGVTSCHVPIGSWGKLAKHVNVNLSQIGASARCAGFLPKSAVNSNGVYYADFNNGACIITQ